MNADWAGVFATILIASATGGWAVWRWSGERTADRRQKAELTDALYLVPFVAAADDLQSRLFNLLHNRGLVPLRKRYPDGRYAEETMFLLARFFGWEQQLLRFTFLATEPSVVAAARHVRKVVSTDEGGLDPWCFFRATQTALGQSVIVWREGAGGFADTISVIEFERQLSSNLAHDLGLEDALESLRSAQKIEDLSDRSLRRLEDLRIGVVALIEAVDTHLTGHRGGISVISPASKSSS